VGRRARWVLKAPLPTYLVLDKMEGIGGFGTNAGDMFM